MTDTPDLIYVISVALMCGGLTMLTVAVTFWQVIELSRVRRKKR